MTTNIETKERKKSLTEVITTICEVLFGVPLMWGIGIIVLVTSPFRKSNRKN